MWKIGIAQVLCCMLFGRTACAQTTLDFLVVDDRFFWPAVEVEMNNETYRFIVSLEAKAPLTVFDGTKIEEELWNHGQVDKAFTDVGGKVTYCGKPLDYSWATRSEYPPKARGYFEEFDISGTIDPFAIPTRFIIFDLVKRQTILTDNHSISNAKTDVHELLYSTNGQLSIVVDIGPTKASFRLQSLNLQPSSFHYSVLLQSAGHEHELAKIMDSEINLNKQNSEKDVNAINVLYRYRSAQKVVFDKQEFKMLVEPR